MKKFNGILFTLIIFLACQSEVKQTSERPDYVPHPKAINGERKAISKRYQIQDGKEILQVTIINTFDENGNRVEHKSYSPDSSIYVKGVFEYHPNGKKKSTVFYERHGLISTRYETKYDDKNNEIESVLRDSTGKIIRKYLREYEEGRLMKSIVLEDTVKSESLFEYDTKGRRVSRQTYENGELAKKELTEYEDY
jgi:antitoxin component YwqK of YwqJK toxin-antitoxin module